MIQAFSSQAAMNLSHLPLTRDTRLHYPTRFEFHHHKDIPLPKQPVVNISLVFDVLLKPEKEFANHVTPSEVVRGE